VESYFVRTLARGTQDTRFEKRKKQKEFQKHCGLKETRVVDSGQK
jgi:hypothetical protein